MRPPPQNLRRLKQRQNPLHDQVLSATVNCLITLLYLPGYFPFLWYCVRLRKGARNMRQKLLTNGNIFKRTDGRWNGVVWCSDEQGAKKRKSFCRTTRQEVKEITAHLADFDRQLAASDESKAKLEEHMDRWLQVFKFPSAEGNLRPPGMYRQAPDLSDHRQQGGGRHHLSGHQGVA